LTLEEEVMRGCVLMCEQKHISLFKKSCLRTWTWNWCFNWVLFLWQPLFWLSSWMFLCARTHTVCYSTFPLSNTYTTQTHAEANNWTKKVHIKSKKSI